MTVGDHFERVAAVYESLRTTDEAPVRAICQLLPDRPVTGVDIGCGTGRYTRLLHALLPGGSLLAASDVSAAMLAQLKAASHGHAGRVVPLLSSRRTAAAADRQPRCGHRVQLRSPLRPRPLPGLGRPGAGARRSAVHLHPHPAAERAHDLGPLLPGLHRTRSSACTARPRSGTPSSEPAGCRWSAEQQTFSHPRSSTAERLQAQAEGRHYSTFSLYTPQELRASTAAFLARLPSPQVCWVDEHLLIVVGASHRNQAEPDGPGSRANQAVKDQAPQISARRAGQTPHRRPSGRAQITRSAASNMPV